MTDEDRRLSLVRRLEPYLDDQDCYEPTPLVPLELYFEGNDDEGSIGCNLANHPGIPAFYEALLKLRAADRVSGVWVIAKQHDWKEGWPHSDEVLVRTTLADAEVAAWFAGLGPDEVSEAREISLTSDLSGSAVGCARGERHVVAWWD